MPLPVAKHRWGGIIGVIRVVPPDCLSRPKTLDAGMAQLTRGLAWHYKKYAPEQPEQDRESYAATENEARLAGSGLWREPAPIPP